MCQLYSSVVCFQWSLISYKIIMSISECEMNHYSYLLESFDLGGTKARSCVLMMFAHIALEGRKGGANLNA